MKAFPCWWVEDGRCACPDGGDPGHRSAGKHPLTHNGVKDASDDPNQIARWRERWPKANWAIATGDGLVVIDLDIKPGKNGVESLKALGTVPRTRTVRTGGGGLHLYFRGDASNSSGLLGVGIDVRGTGGYVMAPGSGHISGGRYTVIIDTAAIALPAMLAERLHAPLRAVSTPATDRGFFPAASAEVIDAARAALETHGPAVEGQGGDEHTFKAAALLVHDFALTEDEAWPLLEEWNEGCQPPWNEDDLAGKLDGGQKYGKNPYGCRRTLDAVEAAKKLIADWRASGTEDAGMFPMLDKVRLLTFDNVDKLGVVERELVAATGLKVKALGLPKARRNVEPPKGSIEVTTQLHDVADKALKAIAPDVFQRNGVLCEIVPGQRTFISDLEPAGILDRMSRAAKFHRQDEKGAVVSQAPPPTVASILHARRIHPRVRVLEAITTAPVFLADGSILQERGYNAAARVFLEPSVTVDVPEAPTLDDARESVRIFWDLLGDFKFQQAADFSSWLAGLLSPLVKAATGNAPTPLICVSASSPGAGKTLLTDVIARIVTGAAAEVRPYNPRDPSEWGKRLTAFIKAAAPVSVFDNCNGPFGDESLDRLVTSSTWSDRILGASDAPPLPNVTSWFATGNNIEPQGDTVRRVLMCRIEVDDERPQERSGFKRPLLADYAEQNRGALLRAALTLLRAYHVAGRPSQGLPPWGSFVPWSDLVRGALVWAGAADPFLTQQRAAATLNEPENDAHDFWIEAIAETDGTPAAIVAVANARDAQTVLGKREPLTALHLKRFVGRFVDKPRQGRRIRRADGRYTVETI